MADEYLLEGPFESDYSLAVVNRQLAYSLLDVGMRLILHQRDNNTSYFPSAEFLAKHPRLQPLFVDGVRGLSPAVHSRYIYPPYTDNMVGGVNAIHCYGWEESVFPAAYVGAINRDVDLVTVMSEYVRDVLKNSGVVVPIEVVGLGVDHVLVPGRPLDVQYTDGNEFIFLNVSSCFPRKACDVLVEAFCQEFRLGEKVRLVIKTFPNPHNEVEEVIARNFARYRDHGPITVLVENCDYGQMRFLYEHAGCLVTPSRGEGFGLPVGEAMLLGTPVIATMHSGHAEMCTPETCWPVKYKLAPAKTHMGMAGSYWAEPEIDSLREQMRRVYQGKKKAEPDVMTRVESAQALVKERFCWRNVIDRQLQACEKITARRRVFGLGTSGPGVDDSVFKLGVVTTWNTRCGIAEYSRYLLDGLAQNNTEYRVFAQYSKDLICPDTDRVVRCWKGNPETRCEEYRFLVESIISSGCRIVSFQFNFAFFSAEVLDYVFSRLKRAGVFISITMHSIEVPHFSAFLKPLQQADLCIVHRKADQNSLEAQGLTNVALHAQGLPAAYAGPKVRRSAREFVVTAFGFFLPPKGIYELIQAFSLARRLNQRLYLKLLNAVFPQPQFEAYVRTCLNLLRELNLGSAVEVSTCFLGSEEVLQELADSDLVVLPYAYSTESSSAAVRLPLASLTPVLCSDLSIFAELDGIAHKVAARDICSLSAALVRLSTNPTELMRYSKAQADFVEQFSWQNIARRFQELHRNALTVAAEPNVASAVVGLG